MKLRINTVTNVGIVSGMMTLIKIPYVVKPSITPASSSSSGIDFKNALTTNTVSGMPNAA
ncbi:hypothetical protein D3C78_1810170 [compost metagenome]